MAAEAIFRQVRRPPPRIYRGIALSACWTSDGIAGDVGRRGLTLLLEEGGEALAHACCSELDLLLLATGAPVVEDVVGTIYCFKSNNSVRSCLHWLSVLSIVHLHLTIDCTLCASYGLSKGNSNVRVGVVTSYVLSCSKASVSHRKGVFERIARCQRSLN